MSVLLLALALAAGANAPAQPAQTTGFQLFPVRGVFFPADATEGTTLIRPEFRDLLTSDAGYFEQAFRRQFPAAAHTIDDRNKRRTFAVSLQITRASLYEVPKPAGNIDVYLPLTGSLYFTNVISGEVVFSSTKTHIVVLPVHRSEASPSGEVVRTAFAKNARELVDALVSEASLKYRPLVIGATVRGSWNGLAILDVGRKGGIHPGDTVVSARGGELRIVSVGATYAVAMADLGTFAEGERFERVINQVGNFDRPRVLPLVDKTPPEIPAETVAQLFSDALGEKAPVSLVPVNRTYSLVLAALETQAAMSREQLRQRDLPAFFVRLKVLDPVDFETSTNLSYSTLRVVSTVVLAEVIDRSGRVVFAAHGASKLQDEVTVGVAFSREARREIAVKNALLDLANNMGARLDIVSDSVPIATAGDVITIRDENGRLVPGSTWRVYRPIGRVSGIAEDVLVPTWDVEVNSVEPSQATAVRSLRVVTGAPPPQAGDVLFLEGARSSAVASRKRLGTCGQVDRSGSVEVPGYEDLALNVFAAGIRAPVYSPGFSASVANLVRSGSGFRSDLRLSEPKIDLCVEPSYAFEPMTPSCGGDTCSDVVRARFGFRIREAGPSGEYRMRRGGEAQVKATARRKDAPADARARSLQVDLIEQALKLNEALVKHIERESF